MFSTATGETWKPWVEKSERTTYVKVACPPWETRGPPALDTGLDLPSLLLAFRLWWWENADVLPPLAPNYQVAVFARAGIETVMWLRWRSRC